MTAGRRGYATSHGSRAAGRIASPASFNTDRSAYTPNAPPTAASTHTAFCSNSFRAFSRRATASGLSHEPPTRHPAFASAADHTSPASTPATSTARFIAASTVHARRGTRGRLPAHPAPACKHIARTAGGFARTRANQPARRGFPAGLLAGPKSSARRRHSSGFGRFLRSGLRIFSSPCNPASLMSAYRSFFGPYIRTSWHPKQTSRRTASSPVPHSTR